MSVMRDRPLHMTIFPGGGSVAREITAQSGDLGEVGADGGAAEIGAAFLRELRSQFGNLGLDAAAYNAARSASATSSAASALPLETQNYVGIITGRLPQHWTATETPPLELAVPGDMFCTLW
jgi:hypothetical protein